MAALSIYTFVQGLAEAKAGGNSDNFFDFTNPENAARRSNLELYLQEMVLREPTVLLLGGGTRISRNANYRRPVH